MENTVTHEDKVRYAGRRLLDTLFIHGGTIPPQVEEAIKLAIERIRRLENDVAFLEASW